MDHLGGHQHRLLKPQPADGVTHRGSMDFPSVIAPSAARHGDSLVINGGALNVLRQLADNSVDSICVDPPYELNFTRLTDKRWDTTGIAFDVELWTEALRVLKPGGNLAAFGAARTSHRLAVAIEDAGFELRDQIMVWMYGQGMAKGTNYRRELEKKHPDLAGEAEGFHSNLRPSYEPIILARKPLDGSSAENWVKWHVGGLNIDATRVPTTESRSRTPGDGPAATWLIQRGRQKNESHAGGRWTPNTVLVHRPDCEDDVCAPDCVVPELKRQGLATRGRGEDVTRFFPAFRYQPKAPRAERPAVDGVQHSTVKPLGLIVWLLKLITPPGGTVIDFFGGSGTTAEAANSIGMPAIVVELDPDFIPLIHQRLDRLTASKE